MKRPCVAVRVAARRASEEGGERCNLFARRFQTASQAQDVNATLSGVVTDQVGSDETNAPRPISLLTGGSLRAAD